ncbi:MarR family winged helix-turn-helix transcriptional regulator [Novosphingobium aerophilum]|uniref:MarR family winged helix-turn-helix transcriptional regulator n=1 Tax=Novosphingobium TaxID=165696 RepID=UPI0006C8BEF2|nr:MULTISPECIES: MarR family transcriptional regulator [unclassified Novosphingobium]KPH66157.1 MarR family transcriptional regulator [Novosphingobium sp. ST904]MPS67942.1 MarR family transcriptional regulator [Novosphingobium sp.]TCM27165.1 DNA-binding MarR family transcriptional regulator [Novosphingobium sp. ST904]WRT95200.1 MarR family transcriptional regulator [Novosphingobium sp. RL4]
MEIDLTPAALLALRKILDAAELENRKMAAATSLTSSQALVLRQIGGNETITPSAVASALGFGQATITNIVDRLVAAQLVTRTRGLTDKRQVLLQVTELGREKLKASPFPLQMRFSQGYAGLASWEQAMILAALERLDGLLTPESAGLV